ncbi:minor capsid protein [Streptomyces sp. TP-A0875]|uniref:minor capsid protein n=1 Tax=Streptomyces sp. TP-A0875 TaxID=552354 RepID=UPI0006B4814E|nr:minor capsid protein [Streptomyces sp. TP-A0875]
MSYTSDLLDGVARLLAEAGVGTYRPDGVYGPDDTAITIATVPPTPDRVICLTDYPVEDSAALTDTITGVQVRTRAGPDPREVADLDDAAHDVLQGSGPHPWGDAYVSLIYRTSAAPLGPDANGRHERTANYYARGNRRGSPHLE